MDQGDDYKALWDTSQEAVVPHRLASHPAFKRMGVAKSLLTKAEAIAKEKGLRSVRIDTNQKNKATNTLFPQLGYQYVGNISLTGREGLFSCYEKFIVDL
jgi:GNAT superfamily N-acetyltransferase